MENTNSMQPGQLTDLLAQRVEINRADLESRYLGVLKQSLFSNRAEVRPSALKNIAAEEVETLLRFLTHSGFSAAERGEQLHREGFNAGAILKLIQITRQFLLNHLENHQIALMLEIVDTYQLAIIEGFVQSIDKTNLSDLEQLRSIMQRKNA